MKHTEFECYKQTNWARARGDRKRRKKCARKWKTLPKKSEKLVAIIQCQSFWCLFFQNFWDWQNNNTCQSSCLRYNLFFSFPLARSTYLCVSDSTFSIQVDITFFCSHSANHSTMSAHQKFTWVCSLFLSLRCVYSFQFSMDLWAA